MASSSDGEVAVRLQKIEDPLRHGFSVPAKRINDGDDLHTFHSSTAYADLTKWTLQLTRAMFPTILADGQIRTRTLNSPPVYSEQIGNLRRLLDSLRQLMERAPPDTGPRRFGNVAFRKWHHLAEEGASSLLGLCLKTLSGHDRANDELKAYLMGSFGSASRLDYGTGHELSFLAFLGCLWKLGAFQDGEEEAIVTGVVEPYLDLVRCLISTYTLEPAGSHGVWGLDDHSFVPYIFGSAQFGPPIAPSKIAKPIPTEGSLSTAPAPSSVMDKATVRDYKQSNMYFSAIQFIYDVKKGPFWEHSPVLYDISGIKDGWAKINKGMLKMYAAEVLGKFPVVQHFPFGSLFQWETDANAVGSQPSVHSQQQPRAKQREATTRSQLVGAGTTAPWARPGSAATPQMQASTGLPSPRMSGGGYNSKHRTPPAASRSIGLGSTTAAPNDHETPAGVPRTTAPWARKDAS